MAGEGSWPKVSGDIAYASDFNRINIVVASTTVTTAPTTTSTSFVDMTGYTLTISGLDSAESYKLVGIISSLARDSAANTMGVQIVIDGTASGSKDIAMDADVIGEDVPFTLIGTKTVTGATSYIVKLQGREAAGNTLTINGTTTTSTITAIAFPQ